MQGGETSHPNIESSTKIEVTPAGWVYGYRASLVAARCPTCFPESAHAGHEPIESGCLHLLLRSAGPGNGWHLFRRAAGCPGRHLLESGVNPRPELVGAGGRYGAD